MYTLKYYIYKDLEFLDQSYAVTVWGELWNNI